MSLQGWHSSWSLLQPFQYTEILAIPLVEKCEVGGQRIFVYNSFQINVRRDTKKVIAEI